MNISFGFCLRGEDDIFGIGALCVTEKQIDGRFKFAHQGFQGSKQVVIFLIYPGLKCRPVFISDQNFRKIVKIFKQLLKNPIGFFPRIQNRRSGWWA